MSKIIVASSKQSSDQSTLFHFIFSAQTQQSLIDYLKSIKVYLEHHVIDLQQLSYNLSVNRTAFDYRIGFLCSSRHELILAIDAFLANPVVDKITSKAHKIAFVFSGQGNEWNNVGQDLYATDSAFRDTIHQCQSVLVNISKHFILIDFFNGKNDICAVTDNLTRQMFIFMLQMGLAVRWISLGLVPYAVCGHSMGEVTAACMSGLIDLEHAIRIIYHRGQAVDLADQKGGMLVVNLGAKDILSILSQYTDVWIAVENSPSWSVLSGNQISLKHIASILSQRNVSFKFMDHTIAFHSPYMQKSAEYLSSNLIEGIYHPTHTRFFSTVTGHELHQDLIDRDHWVNNLIGTVQFKTCIANLLDADIDIFIEIGPHTVLSGFMREIVLSKKQNVLILSSLVKHSMYRRSFYGALIQLYRLGFSIPWPRLFETHETQLALPHYCWDRQTVKDIQIAAVLENNIPDEENEFMTIVTEIWQEILSIENIELDVDMSIYNVNSLNVIQFISRIRSFLGIDLDMAQLINYRTIKSVAEYIANLWLQTVDHGSNISVCQSSSMACVVSPDKLRDVDFAVQNQQPLETE